MMVFRTTMGVVRIEEGMYTQQSSQPQTNQKKNVIYSQNRERSAISGNENLSESSRVGPEMLVCCGASLDPPEFILFLPPKPCRSYRDLHMAITVTGMSDMIIFPEYI